MGPFIIGEFGSNLYVIKSPGITTIDDLKNHPLLNVLSNRKYSLTKLLNLKGTIIIFG